MQSIWNNTFYHTQPALSWVYKLDMSEYYDGDLYFSMKLGRLTDAIISVNVGKRESEFAPVYYGGISRNVFTRAKNVDTFTLRFNEDKNYTITNILEQIYDRDNMHQNYPLNHGTGEFDSYMVAYNDDDGRYARRIKINAYNPTALPENDNDEENGPLFTLEFYGCRIVSLNEMEYSYESTETIKRECTFVYSYMRRHNKGEDLI